MPHFFYKYHKMAKKEFAKYGNTLTRLMKQDVIPKLLLCTLISLIQIMCYLQDATLDVTVQNIQ